MAVAYTVEKFLLTRGMPFDVLKHPHTITSLKCAEAAHVHGERLAKAVLLKDDEGYMVAVLPATHHVRLGKLLSQTGRSRCRKSDRGQKTATFLP